ncbi:hypothetical protein K525DRAFT_186058 [Schizophyllum commune Loenen D]|nr:hypothetical protein K525DRAFT_186058 [Schizophyllum commune Loenen D]
MIHDPPKFLAISVKLTLEFESSQFIVGPNPRRSKLYSDILANLNVDAIPTQRPFGRPQWLVITNALESICALVFLIMYTKDGHKAPPETHRRIIDDTLPLVWKWLVFLHPDSAYFGEDELREATARYGWTRYADRTRDWVHVMLATYYNFMTAPAEGGPAMLAMPDAALHIFNLWYSRMVRFCPDEPSDHSTAELLQALTNLLFKNIPLAIRLKEDVLCSKGEAAIRKIIRRLRENLHMENPEFLELSNLAELLLSMAHAEDIRPLLRPMLRFAVPFMEMMHHPGAATFHMSYKVAGGLTDDSCIAFFTNGFLMLDRLSCQFRTIDDSIRVIRAGLLRSVFYYLQKYIVPNQKICIATQACKFIIGPALHFRSGLKAVSEALDRDNLPRSVEGGSPGRDAWNTMCSLVEERLNWAGEFASQTLTLQHCHNVSGNGKTFGGARAAALTIAQKPASKKIGHGIRPTATQVCPSSSFHL